MEEAILLRHSSGETNHYNITKPRYYTRYRTYYR